MGKCSVKPKNVKRLFANSNMEQRKFRLTTQSQLHVFTSSNKDEGVAASKVIVHNLNTDMAQAPNTPGINMLLG